VLEFRKIFHTLRTKLGIKDYEISFVIKYRYGMHRYIQEETEFLYISSLGTTYRYAVKIEKNLKQKLRQFGSRNPSRKKHIKGSPNLYNKGNIKYRQSQYNQSKTQTKNDSGKMKKDTRKWCDFHKSIWHNIVDFCSK
jgi:hypothetical protein